MSTTPSPVSTAGALPADASLLVLNAGSSTLKFAVFVREPGPRGEDVRRVASGMVDAIESAPRLVARDAQGRLLVDRGHPAHSHGPEAAATALDDLLAWLTRERPDWLPDAIGHRIVMGGTEHGEPLLIDDAVLEALTTLADLAPLHQPAGLAGIGEARRLFPRAPQVACFDTAFHRTHGFVFDTYALPREWFDQGVRRFGFHGLSYEYIASRLATIPSTAGRSRAVVAHLGSGASVCAIRDGRSVTSTMGFSTLDGLPMGTRPGQLDPGVLLWLMQARGWDVQRVAAMLYRDSGLKGLSGISNDLRALESSGAPAAHQTLDYLDTRVRMAIAEMCAALEGIDVLVFAGGIGENSARTRAAVVGGLGWLGLRLDPRANAEAGERARQAGVPEARETRITTDDSVVPAWVIPTDEESTIARHLLRACARAGKDRDTPAA